MDVILLQTNQSELEGDIWERYITNARSKATHLGPSKKTMLYPQSLSLYWVVSQPILLSASNRHHPVHTIYIFFSFFLRWLVLELYVAFFVRFLRAVANNHDTLYVFIFCSRRLYITSSNFIRIFLDINRPNGRISSHTVCDGTIPDGKVLCARCHEIDSKLTYVPSPSPSIARILRALEKRILPPLRKIAVNIYCDVSNMQHTTLNNTIFTSGPLYSGTYHAASLGTLYFGSESYARGIAFLFVTRTDLLTWGVYTTIDRMKFQKLQPSHFGVNFRIWIPCDDKHIESHCATEWTSYGMVQVLITSTSAPP